MPAGTVVGIVVAVVVLLLVVAVAGHISARTYRLRKRFGPEYDRLVAERASRRQAETELTERERRVDAFTLRDLSSPARALFRAQWADVQELFVDAPAEAIGQGRSLVEQVMRERGYPVAEFDQMLADLSVRHARTLDRFRSAHDTSEKATSGEASTEDLRVALLGYRALFDELLGAQVMAQSGAAEDEAIGDKAIGDGAARNRAAGSGAAGSGAPGNGVARNRASGNRAAGNGHREPVRGRRVGTGAASLDGDPVSVGGDQTSPEDTATPSTN